MCPDLPDSAVKINDVEVAQDAPVSEALFDKIGSDINDLLDRADAIEAADVVQDGRLTAVESLAGGKATVVTVSINGLFSAGQGIYNAPGSAVITAAIFMVLNIGTPGQVTLLTSSYTPIGSGGNSLRNVGGGGGPILIQNAGTLIGTLVVAYTG